MCAEDNEHPPVKKQRVDYSAFRTDVARLQKNLEDFEYDLKQHTLQVLQPVLLMHPLAEAPTKAAREPPEPEEAARAACGGCAARKKESRAGMWRE